MANDNYSFTPEGVYPALPTPMDENHEINYTTLREHLEYLSENDIPGVVPAGCTGHAATLPHDEHVEYVSRVADMAGELGLDVIAGSGTNSTWETIELASEIEEVADIDAHLHISPYQVKPAQRGNVQHYETVAEELEEDIIAYNVPSRTGRNLLLETQERISEIPGVIGMKEASPLELTFPANSTRACLAFAVFKSSSMYSSNFSLTFSASSSRPSPSLSL